MARGRSIIIYVDYSMQKFETLDVDQLIKLFNESPAEFAELREQLIHRSIRFFSDPEEGYRLQSEIDKTRYSCSVGQGSYDLLVRLIQERVKMLGMMVETLQHK